METKTYFRKPFGVEAVQVTEDNMEEVAEWCDGRVQNQPKGRFIVVPVNDPKTERQKKAFVGDWVLNYEGRGFKSYTDSAFHKSFGDNDDYQELRTVDTPVDSAPIQMNAFEEPRRVGNQTSDSPLNSAPIQTNVFNDPNRVEHQTPVNPSDQISGKR